MSNAVDTASGELRNELTSARNRATSLVSTLGDGNVTTSSLAALKGAYLFIHTDDCDGAGEDEQILQGIFNKINQIWKVKPTDPEIFE